MSSSRVVDKSLLCAFVAIGLSGFAHAGEDVKDSESAASLRLVLPRAGRPPIDFNRDVRPVLADKCYACHGPDPKTRKGNLRFDDGVGAFEKLDSGQRPVVPGNVESSVLVRKILARDPDQRMPPSSATKHLTQAEVNILVQWIAEGAEWTTHWAWVAPKPIDPPVISNPQWSANPIDRFIRARLLAEGLRPSPVANRETLIRRVTLDLTGVPPTLDEIDAFLADRSPGAYERVVDQLLQSPRYGEHMARHWLDLARYADTHGYHGDGARNIWRWRDWVINAFNQNMPFDQFTIDQLAGDLVPAPTVDQRIATGFNRNHVINGEVGAFIEEYRTQYVFDRLDTTGTVWLGLTVGCAKCHSHKYDPISQTEYYRMFAFFNNVSEMDGNPVPTYQHGGFSSAPTMLAPRLDQRDRLARLSGPFRRAKRLRDRPMATVDAAQADWESNWVDRNRDRWLPVRGKRTDEPSGSGGLEGLLQIDSAVERKSVVAMRLDVIPQRPTGPKAFVRELSVEVVSTDDAGQEHAKPITLSAALSDRLQAELKKTFVGTNDPAHMFDGNFGRIWNAIGADIGQTRTVILVPDAPFDVPSGSRLRVRVHHNARPADTPAIDYQLSTTSKHGRAFGLAELGPWHSCGPFVSDGIQDPLEYPYEPESKVDLAASHPNGQRKWTRLTNRGDKAIHALSGDSGATYLYREIQSPARRVARFEVGSDESVKVWFNGRVVHQRKGKRDITGDKDPIVVNLRKGTNRLLIKMLNTSGDLSYYFSRVYEEFGPEPLDIALVLANAGVKRSPSTVDRLRDFYRDQHSEKWRNLDAQVQELRSRLRAFEAGVPKTMVMAERPVPRSTHILMRGQYDQLGDQVAPGVPDIFPPLPSDIPQNRLGFAQWLVSPEHPLTARVAVNRYWQQYFGTGIVKSAEDFGSQGERPTHPKLLDWLATEFVRTGWDIKRLQRLIVTSETYKQSSQVSPVLLDRDPENRLLARGPLFRLDAEAIRDSALAISGLLHSKVGGASVKPWQPDGLWEAVAIGKSLNRKGMYVQSSGKDNYRRTMYTFWKRTLPPPNLSIFDAPNRETCVSRRERTNTPLQALTLLNDPQFVEASRAFAERLIKHGGPGLRDKAAYAFRLCTSRNATDREIEIILRAYHAELGEFRENADAVQRLLQVGEFQHDGSLDPAELAAWTTVANMLLNLDETISKS